MWQDENNSLYKKFEFKDFKEAFEFMNEVAKVAEEQQHHPKWLNEWNKVEVWLSTHEEDSKVTDKDRKLSQLIDKIYEEYK
jgi:4a-hydroxytetrahydrobiopterin dehydratase